MGVEDEEISDLPEGVQKVIRHVAQHCAVMDGNCAMHAFDNLPEGAKADYLHDIRNAIEGLADYMKNGGVSLEELRRELNIKN